MGFFAVFSDEIVIFFRVFFAFLSKKMGFSRFFAIN